MEEICWSMKRTPVSPARVGSNQSKFSAVQKSRGDGGIQKANSRSNKWAAKQSNKQADRQTSRQLNSQTSKQTGKQADSQTVKQANRQLNK